VRGSSGAVLKKIRNVKYFSTNFRDLRARFYAMLWCFSLLQPAAGDFFCILCFKNEFPFDFQSLS